MKPAAPKNSRALSADVAVFRFPLESAWGGEEEVHRDLIAQLVGRGGRVFGYFSDDLWRVEMRRAGAKCPFVPPFKDATSAKMLLVWLFVWPLFAAWGAVTLAALRWRGVRQVLMLSLVEKALLTLPARAMGLRVVWGFHAPLGRWITANPLRWLLRAVPANAVVVPSATLAQQWQKLLPKTHGHHIYVLPNAVPGSPAPRSSAHNMGNKRVLFAARLAAEKRPEMALELAKHFPNVQFCIVGEGPLLEAITQKAGGLANAEILGFLPEQDLETQLAKADIFLALSRQETFGISALRALRAGCALVCPRAGALAELASGAVFFFEKDADAPAALQRALQAGRGDVQPAAHAEYRRHCCQSAAEYADAFLVVAGGEKQVASAQ